jgi:hypothetical protein
MSNGPRLRILLVLKHAGYAGVFTPLVQELAARGHAVHVGWIGGDREGVAQLDRLAAQPGITHGHAPRRGLLDGWTSVAWLARALGDLGRYSHPRFADAAVLRNRMATKVESHLTSAGGFDPLTRRAALKRARRLHAGTDAGLSERAIERSARLETGIPAGRRVTAYVREQRPDVVLVSPLIDLASPLLDYLKAARRLGIRTGICVASWDNLTSKGLLRFVPERVFVWNEAQRGEATELHGIPADRVVATGAARFDDWFAQQPSSSRDEFTRRLVLDPGHPYLLYLCSSSFVAPEEVAFVSRWLEGLRGSGDERLRGLGVVVRPHPKREEPWRGVDLSRFGNATVWARPSDADPARTRADFYDSIAHSAGVVGVNTSAMIEAAIVGKSVYTVLAPEFAQEETIHFHYLLYENGGFLHVASSLDEHLEQLRQGLSREAEEADRTRRFVESFLRPNGLERSATAIYADGVEEVAALPVASRGRTSLGLRLALTPIALASTLALTATIGKAALRSRLPGKRGAEARKPRVAPIL